MELPDPKNLRPGDVLLYRGKGILPWAIRLFDGSDYSHAGFYVGGGEVIESLAHGVTKQTLQKSAEGARFVHARRLKTTPDLRPVVERAQLYLSEGNRYAYEQIVLLAVLALTRKLPMGRWQRVVLRRTLDAAAATLNRWFSRGALGERRDPLMCSELVYRAYDEALPAELDAYSLAIAAAPRAAPLGDLEVAGLAPATRGVHPESCLAWAVEQSGAGTPR